MKGSTLRLLRRLHLYVAVFFAPAIIFFAFSGMLQTYGFHEAEGGHGEPPAWLKAMGTLHKHQQLSMPERPGRSPAPAPAAGSGAGHDDDHAPAAEEPAEPASTAMLKAFVGLTGLGLVVASLLGLAVALGTRSTRRVSTVAALLGLALPVALILA